MLVGRHETLERGRVSEHVHNNPPPGAGHPPTGTTPARAAPTHAMRGCTVVVTLTHDRPGHACARATGAFVTLFRPVFSYRENTGHVEESRIYNYEHKKDAS